MTQGCSRYAQLGFHAAAAALFALSLAACEAKKSSNPLSPSVAGPIPSVSISAPKLLEPLPNQEFKSDRQPITFLIENALSTGVRPLSYLFEIANDASFSSKVFTQGGVAQGEGGRTSFRLPDALAADRSYYWRARAEDGANTGPFADAAAFLIVTPSVIEPPLPVSPVADTKINSNSPVFKFRNARRSGPVGEVVYTLEVSGNEPFTQTLAILTSAEQPNETTVTPTLTLGYDKQFFWRVRGYDATLSPAVSSWSPTQVFRTPPPPPPPPAPGPGPSPGGGCGPPYPNNGPAIIACVAAKYPDRLVGGVSLGQRQANMAFLRDRIIETGKCGGMDLGWNLKRGGPDISIDFITERVGGFVNGIDIAHDYDNTGRTLTLQWIHGEFPFYKAYPTPSCP